MLRIGAAINMKMKTNSKTSWHEDLVPTIFLIMVVFSYPGIANAYIGPGAGITVIGTIAALFGALLLAVIGFVWYPLKRLIARRKKTNGSQNQ